MIVNKLFAKVIQVGIYSLYSRKSSSRKANVHLSTCLSVCYHFFYVDMVYFFSINTTAICLRKINRLINLPRHMHTRYPDYLLFDKLELGGWIFHPFPNSRDTQYIIKNQEYIGTNLSMVGLI